MGRSLEKKEFNWLSWIFQIISLIVIIKAFVFMLNAPVWGPVDELSHMDYIEKLSSTGKLPRPYSTIEESIFKSIPYTKNQLPENFDGTRSTLGITNLSYEEQQPPVYYLILAAPNKMMLMVGLDVVYRVKILRIISFLLLIGGICLIIPIFRTLNSFQNFTTGKWLGSLGLLFSTLVCLNNKHGLGNDILSPLMINLSVFFLLLFQKYKIFKYFIWGCIMASLAFLTKYTNIIYTGFALLVSCIQLFNQPKENRMKYLFVVIGAMMFIPGFIIYKYYILSTSGIAGYSSSTQFFSYFLPAGILNFKIFLQILFDDMFNINFLGIRIKAPFYLFLVPIAITSIFTLVKFKTIARNYSWVLYSMGIMFLLSVLMFCLNKYIAGVLWCASRHYIGYHIFWFVGFFGSIPIILNKRSR